MEVQTMTTPNTNAISNDDLDMMLADLDLAVKNEPEIETDEIDETLLAELEADIARAEVYQAQEATSDPTPVSATAASKPARKKSANAVERTPRKNLSDLDDDVFQLFDGEVVGPTNKQVTIDARPKQVKVAEKFDNLFLALAAGKEPSSYVVTAFKVLSATGTMTSADLVAAYKTSGLKDGTARSQTGQIMELFNVVGIARRSGQSLTLRTDSVIAQKLGAIINKPAA